MAYTKVVLTRRKNCDHLSSRPHQRLHSMGQIEIEENRLYALSNREKTSRERTKGMYVSISSLEVGSGVSSTATI